MSNQQSNVWLSLIVLLLVLKAHMSEPVAAAWQKRAYPLSCHSLNCFALWVSAFGSDAQTWRKPTVGKPQACGDIWIILSDILTSQHVGLFVTCRLHSPSVKKPNCAPGFPHYYYNYRLCEWCYLLQINANMFSVNKHYVSQEGLCDKWLNDTNLCDPMVQMAVSTLRLLHCTTFW